MLDWANRSRRHFFPILILLGGLTSLGGVWRAETTSPERDGWQRPNEVMEALGVRRGSVVADVGCGRGYFTFHLARRVGSEGKVYAEDIDKERLASVEREARERRLSQIEAVEGTADDPGLPAVGVDVVLVVNAYHEFRHYQAMLEGIFKALKPGGLLGLIDGSASPGSRRDSYARRHRIPEQIVREEALHAGFQFLGERPGFTRPDDGKEFYFAIFRKPLGVPVPGGDAH